MPSRPAVAVVLPFHGSREEAEDALARLAVLELGEGDEVVLTDNTPDEVAASLPTPPGVRVVVCDVKQSAYAARNIGAEQTTAPWLLFVDADVRLSPDLLDRYFEPPPGERVGALSGGMEGTPDQPGLVPHYIRSRHHLDNAALMEHPYRPVAVTANLAIRREAFEEIGGFQEATRAGADNDICYRLQDAGWTMEHRPAARATHDHRATFGAFMAQTRRDGASAPWLAARHPGYDARTRPRMLVRALVGALGWPLRGQPRRGLYKAIDGVWHVAFALGERDSNAAPLPPQPARVVVVLDEFPRRDDPIVAAAASAGPDLRVEARRRPDRPDWTAGRRARAAFWEDDPRHPRRAARTRLAGDSPDVRILAEPAAADAAREIAGGRPVEVLDAGALAAQLTPSRA